MVDGDAVDSDKCVFGSLPKRTREVEDVLDGGWTGVVMVDREDLWKAVRGLYVDVEGLGLDGMGDGSVKPAVRMIRGKNASLCVIPPFLKEWEGMIGGRIDKFQAVRTGRKGKVLCGGVKGGAVGERQKEVGEGGVI